MGQINVTVGGRNYTLACRDGEEERLSKLAGHINEKSEDLTRLLGQVSESRMLLMSALLVADELFDARDKSTRGSAAVDAGAAVGAMSAAADRIEAMCARLDPNPFQPG